METFAKLFERFLVFVGSEEARFGCPRAGLRPPLKLHVRVSRMQLSRRLLLPGCNRRNQMNKVHQPVLAV